MPCIPAGSCAEAIWVRAVPSPRGFDDRPQVGVYRRPVKFIADRTGVGNECRRITSTAWSLPRGYPEPGDFLNHPYDFPYAVPAPDADVIRSGYPQFEFLKRQGVCTRQIIDVNVVADTCAVGCLIVGAEDGDVW